MECTGGCGCRPSFNFEGLSKELYCSKCKKDGMVDVTNKKCKGGCGTYPSFNFEELNKALYC
eukprot:Pgem_evm1s18058